MISFTTTILKFDKMGEKTGWSYIQITAAQAAKLKPGVKKSFRVKGKLDAFTFKQTALIPMGDGDFIMPINATMRKGIGKRKGATLKVQMEVDENPIQLSPLLLECLEDEPKAKDFFFNQLPKAEQNYFSKWIESAKTEPTKAKRTAQAVNGFLRGYRYGQMIRALKAEKNI